MDTLREILIEINADINKAKNHKNNNYLRNFMECAYIPEKKPPLPEGDPPYKIPMLESDVQSKGVTWQFLRKLDTLRNPALKPLKREVMFIDALEGGTQEEALIFLHMKDQTLEELYPNITLESLKEVGYFDE